MFAREEDVPTEEEDEPSGGKLSAGGGGGCATWERGIGVTVRRKMCTSVKNWTGSVFLLGGWRVKVRRMRNNGKKVEE